MALPLARRKCRGTRRVLDGIWSEMLRSDYDRRRVRATHPEGRQRSYPRRKRPGQQDMGQVLTFRHRSARGPASLGSIFAASSVMIRRCGRLPAHTGHISLGRHYDERDRIPYR